MRLIECNIVGFGNFRDYRLTFDEGLNVVLQPNGWGKTTVAAFIKAMLYGFERKRVRNLSENERLRYLPWDGGKYGGSLDFELHGETYRVVRQFGKTGAGDSVRVLSVDTGRIVEVPRGEVGEWVFGLDANAFQKSAFVGQNGFGFDDSTSGLRSRLNALVNEADDVAGLDHALAMIDQRRKYYKKKTGGGGAIADAGSKVSALVERQNELGRQIAQLGELQRRLAELDDRIAEVSGRLDQAQARFEATQNVEKDLKALVEVRSQLVSQKRAAEEEYTSFCKQHSAIPDARELETTRKAVDTLAQLKEAVSRAQSEQRQAGADLEAISRRHGGVVPAKDDVDAARMDLAELEHQMEVIGLAGAPSSPRFKAIDEAVARDGELLGRADAAIAAWPTIERQVAAIADERRQLDAMSARWAATRNNLSELEREASEASAKLPEDANERWETLRESERILRECARESERLAARGSALDARLAALSQGEDEDRVCADDEDLNAIDEALAACERAGSEALASRRKLDDETARLDELRPRVEACGARYRRAQTALANAKAAKADAVAADAEAKAAKREAEAGGKVVPTAAIGCIVAGIVAAAAAFVLGFGSPVSFAALAAGVALAAVGFVLLAKGSSAGSPESAAATSKAEEAAAHLTACESAVAVAEDAERKAKADAEHANESLERQTRALSCARAANDAAAAADAGARNELVSLLAALLPHEDVEPETVVVRTPAYREALASAASKGRETAELKKQLREVDAQFKKLGKRASSALAAANIEGSSTFDGYADEAASRASKLEDLLGRAGDARARLERAQAQALGKQPGSLGSQDLSLLATDEAPGTSALKRSIDEALGKTRDFERVLNPLCRAFDVAMDGDVALRVKRLSAALAGYRDYRAEVARSESGTQESRKAAVNLSTRLDAFARKLGLEGFKALTSEVLDKLAADASAAEQYAWSRAQASKNARKAQDKFDRVTEGLARFVTQYGIRGKEPEETLAELTKLASRRDELSRAAMAADERLATWEGENADALAAANHELAQGHGEQMRRSVAEAQGQREALIAERSQCLERRDVLLRQLECYPTVAQKIRLLSHAKQEATAKLFTLQTTAAYLEKARANLDRRYLGGLTERFNDYASAWLHNEKLQVEVAGDFDVAVSEGGSAHDVAGYSTGYQDLLDVCLRMALVDTIFEGEKPFIVMDDPFVNLDQEKVATALRLLAAISQDRQVIYFACHPSRTAGGVGEAAVEFSLPKQREAQELPRARAKREAEERARVQANLVASYHVVPVTAGRASIMVSGERRTITSNLLAVGFEVDSRRGSRDNALEVHFIDAKGRALCERQIVEVVDGSVVPSRLRFSLTTHDDSGSIFELIIHEQGREPSELVARIPYKADISFASDDFGF